VSQRNSPIEQKLAVILAADVAGYSAMMERDERGTFERIRADRLELWEPQVSSHHGRIFKLMGDGLLAEFGSAVQAAECAVALQRGLADRNASASRSIQMRIGINLGEVIIDENDCYGEGVNIAARLQQAAEPGGIWVSGKVAAEVRKSLGFGLEFVGNQQVKNIAEPVPAYRVLLNDAGPVHRARTKPAIPSLAVLPFANMSGDAEQEYFADGIVEDIITALSRFKSFAVAARNSSFVYKDRAIDIRTAARELGVRYVLEGSVRRRDKQVRVTAQLIESETGMHLWAEKFDGDLASLFDFQDRITESVAGLIEPEIRKIEIERARRKPPDNLDAYDLYLRALPLMNEPTPDNYSAAVALLEQAFALDPEFALAAAYAAWTYERQDTLGLPRLTDSLCRRSVDLARTALKLQGDDPHVASVCAWLLFRMGGERDLSLATSARAAEANPNNSLVVGLYALCNTLAGDVDKGLAGFVRALQLSPRALDAYQHMSGAGYACFFKGEFATAVEWLVTSRGLKPDWPPTLWHLAASYVQLDRMDEARDTVARLKAISPQLTLSEMRRITVHLDSRFDPVIDGLAKAGLT
jgi:TolB-like protein